MKYHPINLTIPPGAKVISIAFGETLEETDDQIRNAFIVAELQGSASVPLAQKEARKTGIDILRMSGVPIEMISSAIAAEAWDEAKAMFRTTVLEYLYAKVRDFLQVRTKFIGRKDLYERNGQLGYVVEGDERFTIIGLIPEHDTRPSRGAAVVPLCRVESGAIRERIDDNVTATVMALVENLTGNIIAEIATPIDKVQTAYPASQIDTVIVVDLFEFDVTFTPQEISASISVPMVAYAWPT